MKLSQQQIEQFQRDGYLPVGPVMTTDELVAARTTYDRIFAATEKPSSYRDLGERGDGQSKGAVLQIIDMWKLDPVFERLLFKPDTLDIIEGLLGTPDIRLFHDQALFKPALHGDEVPWHQDNGYWKFDPPNAISLWLALDDADASNGCMRFIAGSHKGGQTDHVQREFVSLLHADADDALAISVPVAAGSAVIHHCQTLHNTKPNHSTRQRRAWVRHYIGPNIKQGDEPVTDRQVLRGGKG